MDERRPFEASAQAPQTSDHAGIGAVAQVASELQHRVYKLTSTWPGAPVEVHRLQETASKTFEVFQRIVQSETESPLDASTTPRNTRLIHDQLSTHLSIARNSIEGLIDIISFVQSHPHRDAAELSRRWTQRRERVSPLKLKLSDSLHQVLTQLSLLKITVSVDNQHEGSIVAGSSHYDLEGASTLQALPEHQRPMIDTISLETAKTPSVEDRADNIKGKENLVDPDFNMKFRNIDFANMSRGVDVRYGGQVHHTVPDSDASRISREPKMQSLTEEHKFLSSTAVESKSPDYVRWDRMQGRVENGLQTTRHSQNESQFRHLEQVFQMISPFGSQQAVEVSTYHGSELIGTSSPQSQHYSSLHLSSKTGRGYSRKLAGSENSPHLQKACYPPCTCLCHSQAHSRNGILSAFKSAFGSFTFIFSASATSCNISDCVARKGQYLQIKFSFPSWLFHAAISATLKHWTTGSPEMLLRVHRHMGSSMMSTYTSLFSHISRGDVENLKRVLSRREASVYDVSGKTGVATLYHALRLRDIECAEVLLREGADVFQLDDSGLGPYHEALQAMYASASTSFHDRLHELLPMEQIIEAGQLTNLHKISMGILWTSVADYVASHGHADVNAGDCNNATPLYYASARGSTAIVQALLEAGASPDAVPKASSSFAPAVVNWTPLSRAARSGHLDVVERLLKAGAEVNKRSKHGKIALHECAPAQDDHIMQDTAVEITACLLAHGADLVAVDDYGSTPLDSICIRNHALVAAFLIEKGIDTNHRDWEGSNALGNCIPYNSLECAELLLGLGSARSGIRNVDENGYSQLHYLAMFGTTQMMDLFAESGLCGLDPELKDNQGRTPLEVLDNRPEGVELRKSFIGCLDALSRPESLDTGSQDGDSSSEDVNFFDAEEF